MKTQRELLLEGSPKTSIPSTCTLQVEIKAAYRFFANHKVTPEAILSTHANATVKRIKKESVVLCLTDTTEVDFTNNSSKQKLGRLDHAERKAFYSHTTLAVTPSQVPLGVLSNSFFDRETDPVSKTRNYSIVL